MFFGLFLNELFLTLELSKPLSPVPLLLTLSGLTLFLLLLAYRQKGKEPIISSLEKISIATVLHFLFLLMLPILSISGTLYNNAMLLIFAILGIAVLFAATMFSDRLIPKKLFPWAIASASISLLFHTVFISKYLFGWDIFLEFYVFRLTELGSFWMASGQIIGHSLVDSLNSTLSITILPTIYTAILRIDGKIFFKLFYPFVFSIIPLTLYKLYEQQTGKKLAILAVFFFISTSIAFYDLEPLSLARQIIAQLFVILATYVIIENNIPLKKRRVLFLIFAAAIILSHYALAFLFLFFIVSLHVLSTIRPFSQQKIVRGHFLSTGLVLLQIALTFSWFIYVSDSPLNQMIDSFQHMITSFVTDLFSTEARGFEGALTSLSPFATTSLIGIIHKVLLYVEQVFIGIGILVLVFKPKQFKLNADFRFVAIISFGILLLALTIPNFSPVLALTRFYSILLTFLSIFFALGGTFLFTFIGKPFTKLRSRLSPGKNVGLYLVTCVLIASFLFQVGLVNHVTGGYPYSYSLDMDRRKTSDDHGIQTVTHSLVFLDQDVISAEWLYKNQKTTSTVYADYNSRSTILRSYGLIPTERLLELTNYTKLAPQSYVYLKYLNIRVGVLSIGETGLLNTSDIFPLLENCNRIYSNGDSEIYFTP